MLLVYPIVEQVDRRKRASAESVLELCLAERPDLPRPSLHWFGDPVNRDYRQLPKASYILERRPMDGICYPKSSEIWLKATLDNHRLVEVTAHEAFHYMQPPGASEAERHDNEAAALAYGVKATNLLSPRRGLFFSSEHLHHARPGDSTRMKHGDRQWIRTLGAEGGWEWNRVPERYELFVSSKPIISVYQ